MRGWVLRKTDAARAGVRRGRGTGEWVRSGAGTGAPGGAGACVVMRDPVVSNGVLRAEEPHRVRGILDPQGGAASSGRAAPVSGPGQPLISCHASVQAA